MTASKTMDVDWGHVTEQMLNLTLEIIYLLTGEDYILVKTSGLCVISRNHPFGQGKFGMTQSSMMVPPAYSLISEKGNVKKVLEVTNKIIQLLTGEVPIRCQDVTVHFSMEEWEYLEGHKDLYKDVMMEDEPDGSRKRNPPQRCPHPLHSLQEHQEIPQTPSEIPQACPLQTREDYEIPQTRPLCPQESTQYCHEIPQACPLLTREDHEIPQTHAQESTHYHHEIPQACPLQSREDHEIPHPDQDEDVMTIKAEVCDGEEESYVRGDELSKEVEMPPEINTDGHTDLYKDVMMEDEPDGSRKRNPPQRCPRDSTQEHEEIPHRDQFEDEEEDEDEVYTTVYQQCKEEEFPIEISAVPADEHDIGRILKEHLTSPCWDREDDNITEREDQATPLVHPGLLRSPTSFILQESSSDTSLGLLPNTNLGLCGTDWSSGPANPEEAVHHKALRGNKLHLCSFCGKRFTTHANVVRHVRTHTGDRPYSCSLCGKSFTQKSILLNHQKVHTGDRPFPCPDCGKCFAKSSDVIRHRRVHTGERPYLCLQCGKSFTQKFRLRNHQHFHKEEEQSRRLECGWALASKSNQFR